MTAAVRAEVVAVLPSLESVPYVTAVLRFRNDGPRPVRVWRYCVVWDGGALTASPHNLVLPSGQDRDWRVRIDRSHGRLDAFIPGAAPAARVEDVQTVPAD